MKTTYQYRLRPNKAQTRQLESWLELCRKQYNFRLYQRLSWWDVNRCALICCSLISCSIAPLRDQPNYYEQKKDLLISKQLFPEYADLHSQVLQNVVERVKKAYERYTKLDSSGKRSGKPRYKKVGRYRSFTYPQLKTNSIQGNRINLPKIGWLTMILHRPIPDGFQLKTATLVTKAEHWYISLVLEDVAVPEFTTSVVPTEFNTLGIDVGINSFLVASSGQVVENPRCYRSSEKRLASTQQRFAKTKRGSRRRRKIASKLSRVHNKIANQRRDFHHKTAKHLVDNHEVIAHEDLAVKNMSKRVAPKQDEDGAGFFGAKDSCESCGTNPLPRNLTSQNNLSAQYLPNGQSAKSGLNKSILDCGWSSFLSILSVKAEKAGRMCVAVNPYNTSQLCSTCGVKVPKKLKDRWHFCANCQITLDRDFNSSLLIKQRAVGHHVRNAQKDSSN